MADLRIYVACLADYNAGFLHGAWIDCEGKDADDLWQETAEMLRKSTVRNVWRAKCPDCGHIQDFAGLPAEYECHNCLSENEPERFTSAEEWAIHDTEGFGSLVGESTSFKDVAALAEFLCDDIIDDPDHRLMQVRYLVEFGGYQSLSAAIDKAGEVALTEEEPEDYARSFYEDNYSEALEALPADLKNNIDWKGIAHDLTASGAIVRFDGWLVTNADCI